MNSSPTMGIAPSTGTRFSPSSAESLIKPPKYEDAAVFDKHLRADRALVRHEIDGARRPLRSRRKIPCSILRTTASPVDLRRDLQDFADFLALNRLERIHDAGRACWVSAVLAYWPVTGTVLPRHLISALRCRAS